MPPDFLSEKNDLRTRTLKKFQIKEFFKKWGGVSCFYQFVPRRLKRKNSLFLFCVQFNAAPIIKLNRTIKVTITDVYEKIDRERNSTFNSKPNLSNTYDHNNSSLTNWPISDTFVQVLCTFSPSCFTETMMCLIIIDNSKINKNYFWEISWENQSHNQMGKRKTSYSRAGLSEKEG